MVVTKRVTAIKLVTGVTVIVRAIGIGVGFGFGFGCRYTVLYSAVQYWIIPYSTVHYVLGGAVNSHTQFIHSTRLVSSTVQYSTAQYCTEHCTVQ